ncbi:UPF0515 protein [Biomphalaria pfeifferi]|uniref:UPF0515 protein n=1 Tax=Biomphalaria pfeifferi TaxID=112525 RepID=A0AAD8BFC6_BIOPF|nr:UPF0515 protein [Biomphalaria pfeifferi]
MSEHDNQLKARRLRELFRGRFNQNEAELLLQHHQDLYGAANFVLENEPEVVNNLLNRKGEDYIKITIEESKKVKDLLDGGLEKESRPRLFACENCERAWWKVVPLRKEVSSCYRCGVKYDPVPRDSEWGRGRFRCGHCQNEFITTAIMGMTVSLCHSCNYPVAPYEIVPPVKSPRRRRSITDTYEWHGRRWGGPSYQHNCNGVNCYNGNDFPQNPNGIQDNPLGVDVQKLERNARLGRIPRKHEKPAVCIDTESKSLPPAVRVRTWSERHVSTGSTVTTCLDQGDLESCTISLAYTFITIKS